MTSQSACDRSDPGRDRSRDARRMGDRKRVCVRGSLPGRLWRLTCLGAQCITVRESARLDHRCETHRLRVGVPSGWGYRLRDYQRCSRLSARVRPRHGGRAEIDGQSYAFCGNRFVGESAEELRRGPVSQPTSATSENLVPRGFTRFAPTLEACPRARGRHFFASSSAATASCPIGTSPMLATPPGCRYANRLAAQSGF